MVGLFVDAAVARVQGVRFRADVEQILRPTVLAGTIVEQSPPGGSHRASHDNTVVITEVVEDLPALATATPMTTYWRPLDESTGAWPAALAAIRSYSTPDAAVRGDLLHILRANVDYSGEVITAEAVDEALDTASIWIFWRNLGDDSTAGLDIRLRVSAGTKGVVIFKSEIRQLCARSATSGRNACL